MKAGGCQSVAYAGKITLSQGQQEANHGMAEVELAERERIDMLRP